MNWNDYKNRFKNECILQGKSIDFVERCLSYANQLNQKGLPIIYDHHHASLLIGYSESYIYSVSNKPSKFYSNFYLPNKKGGYRRISVPYPSLMEIQKWILTNILRKFQVSRFAKAYIKGENIINNAKFHKDQKVLLKLDIKDFFGSINFLHVYKAFINVGYSKSVSVLLAKLCLLNNKLPQGAPTSPALSNIIFVKLDEIISKYATKKNIRYTRYADDLTFSGDFSPGLVIHFVRNVLRENQLSLNEAKTRVVRQNNRQLVTGIVTNKKLNAPRALRRELSKAAHYIERHGIQSHIQHCTITEENYIEKLLGRASFVKSVNNETPDIDKIIAIFNNSKQTMQLN